MKDVLNKYKSEVRFVLVGGSATLIDFVIYMILSNYIHVNIAKMTSMTISCIYSFFLNKKWTFSVDKNVNASMIIKYVISQIINILTNTLVNNTVFKLSQIKILAFLVATLCAMCVNFILQKTFVFKKK